MVADSVLVMVTALFELGFRSYCEQLGRVAGLFSPSLCCLNEG